MCCVNDCSSDAVSPPPPPSTQPLHFLLIGPPGSGKGTQAAFLARRFGIRHISTGDLLRNIQATASPLGAKIKSVIDAGNFVDDQTMIQLLHACIDADATCQKCGFVLDGFPRTLSQAADLTAYLAAQNKRLHAVVQLVVSDEAIVERLSKRLTHVASGRTYHAKFSPPMRSMCDDVTGELLVRRPDDAPDVIRTRLAKYRQNTEPIVDFYRKQQLLWEVDASDSPEAVCAIVRRVVDAAVRKEADR